MISAGEFVAMFDQQEKVIEEAIDQAIRDHARSRYPSRPITFCPGHNWNRESLEKVLANYRRAGWARAELVPDARDGDYIELVARL